VRKGERCTKRERERERTAAIAVSGCATRAFFVASMAAMSIRVAAADDDDDATPVSWGSGVL